MKKNEILFVGVGQAGNNLISEVLKTNPRYNGLFVNTSHDDIKAIANAKDTFIVPSAGGTARDRNVAKSYAVENIQALVDQIKAYPQQRVVYIAFSMGGGTGSGISPILINVLDKTLKDVKINIVAIVPETSESKKTLDNTIDCWNDLVKAKDKVNTIYLLDNAQKKDKFEVNTTFAKLYDDFISLTSANEKGVIDNAEIETIATASGLGAIYDIEDALDEEEPVKMSRIMKKSIFSVGGTECQYIGISVPEGVDHQEVADVFNPSVDEFVGYTKKTPLLAVGGAVINNNAIIKIFEEIKKKEDSMEDNEVSVEDLVIKVGTGKKKKKVQPKKEEAVEIDDIVKDDDFWSDILNM